VYKTNKELAALCGVGFAAISLWIKRNGVKPAGKRGRLETYDTGAEPLAGYIRRKTAPEDGAPSRKTGAKPVGKSGETIAVPESAQEAPSPHPLVQADNRQRTAQKKDTRPLNDLFSKFIKEDQTVSGYLYYAAYKGMLETTDYAGRAQLAKIAAREDELKAAAEARLKIEEAKEKQETEKAQKLKIANDAAAGYYMARDTVKMIFGQFYATHTGQLQPVGMKVAAQIAGILKITDTEALFKIQEIIDGEIYGALESIQRKMIDWTGAECEKY
jgi:hypothetical protein